MIKKLVVFRLQIDLQDDVSWGLIGSPDHFYLYFHSNQTAYCLLSDKECIQHVPTHLTQLISKISELVAIQ